MLKFKIIASIVCLTASLGYSALITMDISATSNISDYDLSNTGNELKIDYVVQNTTQGYLMDGIYRVLIPAGTLQTVYAVQVPDEWMAVITSNEIEIYTLNAYEAIQCGDSKLFSIYAYNEGKDVAEIQAMSSLGDWATPKLAYVPNGQVPEPTTILLIGSGAFMIKRKN